MPTVLVVDDEPLIRTLMARVLQQEGFSVLTAQDGREAKSVWKSRPAAIDLLISDVVMPGMDGPTLATELLNDDPGMPVLLMSGYCEGQPPGVCEHFEFLSKPFAMAQLVEKVRGLLKPDRTPAPA